MYKIKTTFGTQFNFVKSWTKWVIDDTFLECIQIVNSRSKILVIKISDIQSIQEE